jgi:hypothetical protein
LRCRFDKTKEQRKGPGLKAALSPSSSRDLKCLRENSSFVGRKNGSPVDCSYSVAPYGLKVCFLASPRIASSTPRTKSCPWGPRPGLVSFAPYGRSCRCALRSWAIILRSLREVLPLRGLKSSVLTQTLKLHRSCATCGTLRLRSGQALNPCPFKTSRSQDFSATC